tara:strand:+ start:81845 stop:83689 length:1845 start_codon:yes stop_codon:yes gene_type:complete
MKIRQLTLKNFRSVAEGKILFPGHSAIIGGNSVGKSTMCEALDLCLGPDRLSRSNPINEHDFYQRKYVEDGVPIPIELEVVLTDLTTELETKFRAHREYWNTQTNTLLDETASPEDTAAEGVIPALRIKFEGVYDEEEDEFKARTFFASPPAEEDDRYDQISRAAKRQFGFIYLRALRTGSRALSLERGSLLDIILRLKDDDRSAMWEETLNSLENLEPPIDGIAQLREVLDEIDGRVRRFINISDEERAFRLYPSALTRDDLRKSITLFGSSARSNTPVPYWRLGSGVINSLVFSLLTFIAELKQNNVIFAMEEPEIAIPPHTQRRIVQFLRNKMDQSILTTHSPFVLEQFPPENVVLLERGADSVLSARQIEVTGIKGKTYRGNLRRILAEAMLGNGVICVEGISDAQVLYAASDVLEQVEAEPPYTPLDLSGVTVVHCDGDGGVLRYGEFFKDLGLKIYAFYDRMKNEDTADQIQDLFDESWELDQTGIEYLLAERIPLEVIRRYLGEACDWDDYPQNARNPGHFAYDDDVADEDIRPILKRVLKARKGAGYAEKLIEMCAHDDLPDVIVTALDAISNALPDELGASDEGDEEDEANSEADAVGEDEPEDT